MDDQDQLGPEYLLHEEVGRGARAVVRRATSRFGGPPLAAKLLRPEYTEDRRVRELFLREEAALRDLDHPSIVAVRDLVVERGRIALLMDYVDGPNLRRFLADRGGVLPATEAAWIGAQAAAALAVAHAQGVVHLDLKPENILVVRGTDPTRIRICDFGVAALLRDADHAVVGGTPGHPAPETRIGGPATAAADVYALGVVVREMLGGEVPAVLAGTIAECLADDPRSRPSARALAVRLRAAGTTLARSGQGTAPARGEHRAAALTHADDGAPALTRGEPGDAAGPSTEPEQDRQDARRWDSGAARRPPEIAEPASRWRRGPLLTLAAGLVATAVLAGVTVNAAADQRSAAVGTPPQVRAPSAPQTPAPGTLAPRTQAPQTVAPPVSKPPTDPVADRTRATFAGHVDDNGGTLAISLRDGVAIAYICDGRRVEAWLRGTAAAGRLALTGKGGARIVGTFDAARARGEVTVAGRTRTFVLALAKKPSGLYRAAARVRDAEVVGSWIVLPDGRQVGVLLTGGVPGPAPALDVAGRRTTVDGTAVPTSTVDVDSGEGF